MVPPAAVQRIVTMKTPERPSSWLSKDGLKAHLHQHHPMRRQLNVQDYFLLGPAHPPKSDNVAKCPPVMLEADQVPPKPSKGNPLMVDRQRPAATLYIMYIVTFNGLKVEMAHFCGQWSHSTVRLPCVFRKLFMVYCILKGKPLDKSIVTSK